MQTEDMKRLIEKDKNSPSGFRIVGFKRYSPFLDSIVTSFSTDMKCWDSFDIHCDAFERGILVDGEWFFVGDILEYHHLPAIQVYEVSRSGSGTLFLKSKESNECNTLLDFLNPKALKRIGSIHDIKMQGEE